MLKKTTHASLMAALCLALSACTGGTANSRLDYKEAKPLRGLEVPPDLTAPIASGLEEIPQLDATRQQVLSKAKGIRVQRDGVERWLLLDTSAEELWPKLHEFWPTLGLELAVDAPDVGIMETAWAENRADAPRGFIADMVKKVFKNAYSADTRDKYRLRLEPREDGKVELFLTHYGLKQEVATVSEIGMETAWVVRPTDPELANEVMNRLVLFLGGSEVTAKAVLTTPQVSASRARLEGEQLIVNEGFARTWRLTGIALDRLGLVVDDRNRSEGIYYVSQIDLLADESSGGKGVLGGLFSKEKAEEESLERQILLRGDEQSTRITVRDKVGNPEHGATAKLILQRLQEALK